MATTVGDTIVRVTVMTVEITAHKIWRVAASAAAVMKTMMIDQVAMMAMLALTWVCGKRK